MISQYAAIYLEINLIGILLTLLILSKTYQEKDLQTASTVFRQEAVAVLLILILDGAWALLDGLDSPAFVAANSFINAWYLFQTGVIAYLWMKFVLHKLHKYPVLPRWAKRMLFAPLAALFILCAASPWTHWLFEIMPGNVYQRGPLHFLQQVIGYAYLLGASVYALCDAFRVTNAERRADAMTLCSFIILPALGGVINAYTVGLPTIWPLTAISMIMVYINLQSHQISTDSLTGLNNRRQFDRYLAAQTSERNREAPLYLMLLDIDRFKEINDTYGHAVGDDALVQTAQILKRVCGRHNVFLARYGGDEFAVVFQSDRPGQVEALQREMGDEFSQFNRTQAPQAYTLSFSAGVSELFQGPTTPLSMIERADKLLYQAKWQKGKGAAKIKGADAP